MKFDQVLCVLLALASLGGGCRKKPVARETPLHVAARRGDLAKVQSLLAGGANVNAGDSIRNTPLHEAARNGHMDVVRCLIADGAKTDVRNGLGWTPLYAAVYCGHRDTAELLLSHKADVNAREDYGDTALHQAVRQGRRPGMAELLISCGADIRMPDHDGKTPARIAAEEGCSHVVELLLETGIRVDERSPGGQTLLHHAALRGHAGVVAALLAKGAEVNEKDDTGRTPLWCAADKGFVRTAELLLAGGADPNAAPDSGMTPLHCAACKGHYAVVELLIENGADRMAKTKRGRTPADCALAAGYNDIAALLTREGAPGQADQVTAEGSLSIDDVSPAAGRTDVERLVLGNSACAIDLYRQLRAVEGNMFLSPYSISTALALAYAGARENTAGEIASAMHYPLEADRLPRAFAELQADLNKVQETGNVRLHVANSLWPQAGYDFLPEYLSLLETLYGTRVTPVDFAGDQSGACATINKWVEERTESKIQDLLSPEMLSPPTYLVLVNAIYFKGAWKNEFDPKDTRDEPFYLSGSQSIQVSLMRQVEVFRYAELESTQIIELPYRGDEVSMLVLLPERIEGLRQLEDGLSVRTLELWRSRLQPNRVEVSLPRFRTVYEAHLNGTLQAMGMKDAFVFRRANFAGMDGRPDWLFISGVIHKAYVEVNEEGTEAAAATATAMYGGMAPEPPEFRADHPFLFLIQDNRTGSILFIGRVVDPR